MDVFPTASSPKKTNLYLDRGMTPAVLPLDPFVGLFAALVDFPPTGEIPPELWPDDGDGGTFEEAEFIAPEFSPELIDDLLLTDQSDDIGLFDWIFDLANWLPT